jgi:hypothetical protein
MDYAEGGMKHWDAFISIVLDALKNGKDVVDGHCR